MTTRTALVTGVSGHVGRALAERLQAAGMRVRALVRTSDQAESAAGRGMDPRHGDLLAAATLREAVAGAKVVVHSAAYLGADPVRKIGRELGYSPRHTFEHTLRALVERAAAGSPAPGG